MSNRKDILLQIGKASKDAMVNELKAKGKGNYHLINKITYDATESILTIEMPLYAAFVDSGTKPHMPPVEPIQKWIDDNNLNISAWGTAINISRTGTEAVPFIFKFEETVKKYKSVINKYFTRQISEDTKNVIEKYTYKK